MDFATLKNSLSEVFARMQEKTATGELPSKEDTEQFVRLARLLETKAEDDWADEAADFAHLATQLQQAVKHSQTEEAVMIVESLDDAQSYCHRTYQMG